MIDAALLEKLKTYDTPTICNALEIVDPARRLTGFTVRPLVCPFPALPPIVGYAKTASIRSTHAHELDAKKAREQRIGYYEYIADKPAPGIMVIQDLDGPDVGLGAFWGEVMSAVHKGLGLLGVVTDGSIRDIDQWAPGFQALAGSIMPSHAHVHLADYGKRSARRRHAGALGRPRARRPARRRHHPGQSRREDSRRLRPAHPQGGRDPGNGARARLQRRQAARGAGQARRNPLTPSGEKRMKPNLLKKKIADGVRCVGGWAAIPDPFACEVYAAQGWDSVTIDMQHGGSNINDAVPMLTAIQSAGDATPLIRVPWNDPGQIMRALDAGAMGIICPMINTKAEAEALVRAGRYPPMGERSFGPYRASQYGADYWQKANEEILLFAMVETRQAVSNLEEILSVKGINGVYVGPSDLSLSMGKPPTLDPTDKEVLTAMDIIVKTTRKWGHIAGVHMRRARRRRCAASRKASRCAPSSTTCA